jgi:nitrogen fixation NifU-like protein
MDLYAELILDHAKDPHHVGLRAGYDVEVQQVNPVCGDEVTLRLHLSGTGPDAVVGRPVSAAVTTGEAIREMVRTRDGSEPDEDLLGDAVALQGVAKYPARVKCALLGWTALSEALLRSGALVDDPDQLAAEPVQQKEHA